MNITVAKNAGFCFGVKRAMNKTLHAIDDTHKGKIYTYGPLIHNHQVIQKLESKGIKAIDCVKNAQNHTMIIRSHGVPLKIYDLAKEYNVHIIDATCPFVRKVQNTAKEFYDKGYTIVIIGNPKHPEVIGINGWCNNQAYIIEDIKDVSTIQPCDKICVVAQTTITLDLWNSVIDVLEKKAKVVEKFNTICTATKERQEACAEVSKQVDAMIVIGGYHSSNTQKLTKISKKHCSNTYHIETASELPMKVIKGLNKIGVTAGASTPDWIIKEAIEKMNEQQQDNPMMSMMEEIENSFRLPKRGSIVKGEVIHVTDKEIVVNIGCKADGIIPKNEISNDPSINPHEICKEGDEIEVFVIKTDDGEGNILLSKKRIDANKDWEKLENALEEKQSINVKIVEVVKGGVIAVYNEIRGFVPASQLSTHYVENLKDFVGKELDVRVIDLDKRKRRVVLSHRTILKEQNAIKKQKLWESIEKGQIIEGEVKRIADFGAFVDIGGMDGLVHISDLSWGRVKHPTEVVKIGDQIKVKVLDFDQEKNRISLGLKQLTEEPWEKAEQNYEVSKVYTGKVVKLVDFGAFVELEPGMDGLVHISQMSDKHIAKPSEAVHIGEEVEVKILSMDKENKRMSLSMKEAKEPEGPTHFETEDQPTTIGDIVDAQE